MSRELDAFLQQVQALAEAAADVAAQLRDSGMGYMAERLERALADLSDSPEFKERK